MTRSRSTPQSSSQTTSKPPVLESRCFPIVTNDNWGRDGRTLWELTRTARSAAENRLFGVEERSTFHEPTTPYRPDAVIPVAGTK